MQVVDIVRAMERDLGREVKELRADGGMTANGLLMQLQADFLGESCVVGKARMQESTAMGAAICAGIGGGTFEGVEDVKKICEKKYGYEEFRSKMEDEKRQEKIQNWKRAVRKTYENEEEEFQVRKRQPIWRACLPNGKL